MNKQEKTKKPAKPAKKSAKASKRNPGSVVVSSRLLEDVFVLRRIDGDPSSGELCMAEFVWKDGDVYNDDSNDTPYEHNCGKTYSDRSPVLDVPFRIPMGCALCPCSNVLNSNFSLDQIRDGCVAWLRPTSKDIMKRPAPDKIMDGATLRDFSEFVGSLGGDVFVRANAGSEENRMMFLENFAMQEIVSWEAEPDRCGAEDPSLGTKAERGQAIRESIL